MDTQTVLDIIEMIEVSIHNLEEHLNSGNTNATPEYLKGGMHQLSSLQHHLQSFIEAELSKAEE